MQYRTRKSSTLACRQLRRGDKVAVRFVSDIIPAKVVTASRGEAIVKLLKIRAGRPDERSFDGEVLLYYYPTETVAEPITGQAASGVWRMSGGAGLNGIVYNGFNFVNLSRL